MDVIDNNNCRLNFARNPIVISQHVERRNQPALGLLHVEGAVVALWRRLSVWRR